MNQKQSNPAMPAVLKNLLDRWNRANMEPDFVPSHFEPEIAAMLKHMLRMNTRPEMIYATAKIGLALVQSGHEQADDDDPEELEHWESVWNDEWEEAIQNYHENDENTDQV